MSETQKPNFQDIEDIITEHQGNLYGPAGELVTDEQAQLIQVHQDLIRDNLPHGADTVTIDHRDQPTQELDNVHPLRPKHEFSPTTLEDLKEKDLAPIVISILQIQDKVGKYAHAVDEGHRHHLSYEDILTEESDRFVSALASPEGQRNIEDIPLTQAGIDLIIHGIGRINTPTTKELKGVKKVFDAQQIEQDQDKGAYKSRFGLEFGPYESDRVDKIKKAKEKTEPSTWFLKPEDRAFYEEVITLDNIVTEPDPYVPLPPRHTPIKNAIRSRKENRRAKKYSPPVIDAETQHQIEVSEKLLARWQVREIGDHSNPLKLSSVHKTNILVDVKTKAQKILDQDDELRSLNS